ncbi:similar to Saccharomyces cerevisiae YOR158W PET123 Mitochondrial ribosomal protein of the small subunit [Maudiozyma barnettii]|uniref:Similar to Saccharomyces cerevisiae YOR158W PET123 Mitochondrial ribosomal protein of the small subunit n=1 Tax=Maudiozyma barnettii TaxID=61262 RepID=A0A8H2ZHP8_9SACH|nr:mitochondrial 37S ribosomal protein PET123 [Kazachstania barnettii]CAB4252339.1 similar to Saccharomyces cerevisiae YOR158W PET123 Mitochondrial ribosomal protein of the small subunit [Kazachstania barnettii]CAD1779073.1 similar to Saccharomyces cerevisiae YOR158W PET123 Mitochondrial ribosomal protein of the small subunit [Kazachstania barnettii]
MGKGIAKYGFKSGILPVTRNILKHPTVRQTNLVNKAKEPLPKGENGLGYAEGIQHPAKSRREPKPATFINIEDVISKSIPAPQSLKSAGSEIQETKMKKAQLRRKYLADALHKEEEYLLKREELLAKREIIEAKEREEEMKKINLTKSSDLTIPSLEHIINQPLMRHRTPEETELMKLKRIYNREFIEFKAKERKLEKLLELYYEADQYIVTEEQLLKNIDAIFDETRFSTNTNTFFDLKNNTKKNNLERKIGDELFGTVNTVHPGLPMVKDFLNGEAVKFDNEIKVENNKILEERQKNVDNILP